SVVAGVVMTPLDTTWVFPARSALVSASTAPATVAVSVSPRSRVLRRRRTAASSVLLSRSAVTGSSRRDKGDGSCPANGAWPFASERDDQGRVDAVMVCPARAPTASHYL